MSRIVSYYIKYMPYIKENPDFESDVYNNCLIIERCLVDLSEKNLLSDFDREVINYYYNGYNVSAIAKELEVSRATVKSALNRVTDRVAFILGSDFTDHAVLARVVEI